LIGVVVLFIVGVLTASSYAKIDPKTCVGMWLFDEEDDIVIDSSGNGLDARIVSTVDWVDGKFGMALEFKGNGFVNCGNQEALNVGTNNFSIVAWIKYSETPPDWHATIVEKVDFAAPRHGYVLAVRGALDTAGNVEKPLMWAGLGDANGIHLFGTKPINDGEWHHLAATVDRKSVMKLYRDGNFESQLNISALEKQNEDNQSAFMIGGENGIRTLEGGLVDEVALFRVVLTEDDINSIVQNGLERALGITAVSPAGKLTITWGSVKAHDYRNFGKELRFSSIGFMWYHLLGGDTYAKTRNKAFARTRKANTTGDVSKPSPVTDAGKSTYGSIIKPGLYYQGDMLNIVSQREYSNHMVGCL